MLPILTNYISRLTFCIIIQSQYLITIGDQVCSNYDRRIFYNVTCGSVIVNETTKSLYSYNYLHKNVAIDSFIVSPNQLLLSLYWSQSWQFLPSSRWNFLYRTNHHEMLRIRYSWAQKTLPLTYVKSIKANSQWFTTFSWTKLQNIPTWNTDVHFEWVWWGRLISFDYIWPIFLLSGCHLCERLDRRWSILTARFCNWLVPYRCSRIQQISKTA